MIKRIYFWGFKVVKSTIVISFGCLVLMLSMTNCVSIAVNTTSEAVPRIASKEAGVRVLSWNISGDAFVREPETFRAFVKKAQANVLLLDEVDPSTTEDQIRSAIKGTTLNQNDVWYINFGQSGGRQRDVIVSRLPQESLPEFSRIIPYPEYEKDRIRKRMIEADMTKYTKSLEDGIAVNGVILREEGRRLLVVSMDLECCGNEPDSWEEDRRRIETREIRKIIRQVINRTHIDGIIVAGDFNLVSTGIPLVNLSGPYKPPHAGLIAAELYHQDGITTWTWDGRGTPFSSRAMDFVLYSPNAIKLKEGYIFSTENLSIEELKKMGVQSESSSKMSEHLPLIAEFVWQ
ncbi:endonuclease/exonuclease/phosphatase family protein [Yeosuana marina]|uniref:endonuclease/exonuclease/phosphatase family protein n=1 Tax=Yeosuana marina TaxID=1565536 RepID=UPI00142065BF|nr:endonuclease/exonuclease/phosphatase family protein [Yeosuana marina]